MCSSHIRRTDVLKHSWVDCSRIAEKCGGPKVSRQFQFYSPAISICSRQFQFYSPRFQFAHSNHFKLLTAIYFNLLAAISIYSQQFLLFHGNAHGIFRLPHHLSTTAADSGHQKSKRKIKSRYLKKIFKMKSENQTSKVDSRTLMPVER